MFSVIAQIACVCETYFVQIHVLSFEIKKAKLRTLLFDIIFFFFCPFVGEHIPGCLAFRKKSLIKEIAFL